MWLDNVKDDMAVHCQSPRLNSGEDATEKGGGGWRMRNITEGLGYVEATRKAQERNYWQQLITFDPAMYGTYDDDTDNK